MKLIKRQMIDVVQTSGVAVKVLDIEAWTGIKTPQELDSLYIEIRAVQNIAAAPSGDVAMAHIGPNAGAGRGFETGNIARPSQGGVPWGWGLRDGDEANALWFDADYWTAGTVHTYLDVRLYTIPESVTSI